MDEIDISLPRPYRDLTRSSDSVSHVIACCKWISKWFQWDELLPRPSAKANSICNCLSPACFCAFKPEVLHTSGDVTRFTVSSAWLMEGQRWAVVVWWQPSWYVTAFAAPIYTVLCCMFVPGTTHSKTMFRYSLIHGSRGYLNQAKHSSPSTAPGLTVHWPRIKLRWTLLLNLSLQATHSGLGSGVSWMFEENVYDGRVWLFDPLWCYVECVYKYIYICMSNCVYLLWWKEDVASSNV